MVISTLKSFRRTQKTRIKPTLFHVESTDLKILLVMPDTTFAARSRVKFIQKEFSCKTRIDDLVGFVSCH